MIQGLNRKPHETDEQYDMRIEDITERLQELSNYIDSENFYFMDWEELMHSPEDRTIEWKEGLRDALREININIKFWIDMRCHLADVLARLDEMNVPICKLGGL